MKKIRTILTFIILLICNTIFSQWYDFSEVNLIKKNGDTLVGYGKLDAWKFKFKNLEKKTFKIDYKEIEKATFKIYSSSKNNDFEYLTLYKLDIEEIDPTFFQPMYSMCEIILKNNSIIIYASRSPKAMNSSAALYPTKSNSKTFKATRTIGYSGFYCKVKDEINLRYVYEHTSLKKFKNTASKCFEDCPNLSSKIKNEEFKITDLNKIAEFYSKECE